MFSLALSPACFVRLLEKFLNFIKCKSLTKSKLTCSFNVVAESESRGKGCRILPVFLNLIIVYKKERMHENREEELGLCFRGKLSEKLCSPAERVPQHLSSPCAPCN